MRRLSRHLALLHLLLLLLSLLLLLDLGHARCVGALTLCPCCRCLLLRLLRLLLRRKGLAGLTENLAEWPERSVAGSSDHKIVLEVALLPPVAHLV